MIADAKRGDIGSTARAYAAAYVEPRDGGPPVADAITVNPYLGRESVEPFLGAVQAPRRRRLRRREDVERGQRGRPGPQCSATARSSGTSVARLAREWGEDHVGEHGLSSVGLVIGATYPRAVGEARRLCPQQVLLLPGIGAQGAGPGRRRARVHERPGERARRRVARDRLRLPRARRRLADGGAPRGRRACATRSGPSPAGSDGRVRRLLRRRRCALAARVAGARRRSAGVSTRGTISSSTARRARCSPPAARTSACRSRASRS